MAEEAMFLEPDIFDDAIIGLAYNAGHGCVAYDRSRIIDILVADGMDHEDAEVYFEFNIGGAYVGPTTPIYVDTRWAE